MRPACHAMRAVRILAPSRFPPTLPRRPRAEGAWAWHSRPSPRNNARRPSQKAAEARKKRAELKGELKSGKRTLGDVLIALDGRHRREDEGVGGARVAAGRRQGPRPEDDGRARHLGEPSRSRAGCEAACAAPRPVQEVSHAIRTGKLFVLAGPSGVGKGTIVRELVSRDPEGLSLSVSVTTRAPRPGEVDGVDYFFVDDDAFDRMIRRRRAARVGRGRRAPVGHASGVRRGSARPPAAT